MCGVLYFKGESRKYKELVVALLEQSRIRGLHAFGVSLRPSPEGEFQTVRMFSLPEAKQYILDNEFCELIGHCRYDTSGDWHELGNNQPITVGQGILAFNGVVRMSTREEYQQEFQREYATENDGEIILRMFMEEDRRLFPLVEEKAVSFAGVIHANGKTLALRNERRPLWWWRSPGATFVVSTEDIWKRATKGMKGLYSDFLEPIPPLEAIWL